MVREDLVRRLDASRGDLPGVALAHSALVTTGRNEISEQFLFQGER
jgi:hypothetical protein